MAEKQKPPVRRRRPAKGPARKASAASTPSGRVSAPKASGSGSGGGNRRGSGRRPPRRPARERHIARIIKSLLLLGVVAALFLGFFALSLPSLDKLDTFEKSPGIRVYDHKGKLVATYGQVVGEYVPFAKIPRPVIAAALATEDRRFFHHFGIDPIGLLRAMAINIWHGDIVQGGSTITQQVAKNVFLTPEKTLKRKIQEMLLAFWLEAHFSKEKIMELYLNRVYLGGGNYGIDAAAHHYFDKPASKMNLQESAMLVGLLKAPSRYAPTRDPKLTLKRTRQVLLNMQDAGLLDKTDTQLAIKDFGVNLKLTENEVGSLRYYTDWIVDQIPQYVGRVDSDLEVTTTLDAELQEAGQKAISSVMDEATKRKATQAAMVAMENDGAIRVLIGGSDYAKTQYNRATQARRQPGSSFKLFVYLAALEAGYRPDSVVVDRPVTYGNWTPSNYTNEYRGEMPLRQALALSINTVAAQLIHYTGPKAVVNMARRLGISTPLKPDLSLALGTNEVTLLQLVGAFAHMPNEGREVKPYAVLKIVDDTHKVLYQREAAQDIGQAISVNTAHMMTAMLTGVLQYGTGKAADFGRPAGGKTGTTNDYRDAWFMGFTGQMTAGVWFGNDNNTPMSKVTGGGYPARVWKQFMQAAHQGLPVKDLPTGYDYYDSSASNPDEGWGGWIDRLTTGENGNSTTIPQNRNGSNRSDRLLQQPQPAQQPQRGVFDWFDNRSGSDRRPVNSPNSRYQDNGSVPSQRQPQGDVIYEYPSRR